MRRKNMPSKHKGGKSIQKTSGKILSTEGKEEKENNSKSRRTRADSLLKICLFIVGLGAVLLFVTKTTQNVPREVNKISEMKNDEKGGKQGEKRANPMWQQYTVLETLPHDPESFTQGLTYYDNKLYESIGLYGASEVRQIKPADGSVLASHSLHESFFAEGLTHFKDDEGKDMLIQLTWKRKTGWIYDATTLKVVREFNYETHTGQGWGITYDSDKKWFIVSDGSEYLHFWDRDSLKEVKRSRVFFRSEDDQLQPVNLLNELEFVKGRVLANIWYEDFIVSIDPDSSLVDRIINFSDLYKNRQLGADCLNGISLTDNEDELYVTGKKWPFMYRVKLL